MKQKERNKESNRKINKMYIRKCIKGKIHTVIRIWTILYFTCGKENKTKD